MDQPDVNTGQSRIPFPRLGAVLSKRTGRSAPSYGALWKAASAGAIPVEVSGTGRLFVAEADLDRIAEAFGLLPAPAAAA